MAKGQFISGLKDDVRAKVRLLSPRSLDLAIAVRAKDKIKCLAPYKNPYPSPSQTRSLNTTHTQTRFSPTYSHGGSTSSVAQPTKPNDSYTQNTKKIPTNMRRQRRKCNTGEREDCASNVMTSGAWVSMPAKRVGRDHRCLRQ